MYQIAYATFFYEHSLQQWPSLSLEVYEGDTWILYNWRCRLFRFWCLSECHDSTRWYHKHGRPQTFNCIHVVDFAWSFFYLLGCCGCQNWGVEGWNSSGICGDKKWTFKIKHRKTTDSSNQKINRSCCMLPDGNRSGQITQNKKWKNIAKHFEKNNRGIAL